MRKNTGSRLFTPEVLGAAAAATIVTALFVVVGVGLKMGPTDDAFITYRCAENFAAGHGLVFNPGENVEATSNFLFAVLVGLLIKVGVGPIAGAFAINLCALWLMVFLGVLLGAKKAFGENRRWKVVFVAGICCLPTLLLYAWVGLETLFFTSLITCSFALLLGRGETHPRLVVAGLLLGAAVATRMDALVFFPSSVVYALFSCTPRNWIRPAVFAAGVAAVLLPVFGYRLSFYGLPFPNTYYVKVDGGSLSLGLRGMFYIGSFFSLYTTLPLVLLAAMGRLFARRSHRLRTGFLLSVVLVQIGFCVFVGGDYFPYFRLMAPVLPSVMMLLSDIAQDGISDSSPSPSYFFYGAIALCLLLGLNAAFCQNQLSFAITQRMAAKGRAEIGRTLKENVPSDAVLLVGAAGAIPYYSELKAYDMYGLTDSHLAHREISLGLGLAGHEKFDTYEQVRRLSPDLIVFSEWSSKGVSEKKLNLSVQAFAKTIERYVSNSRILDGYRFVWIEAPQRVAVCAAKENIVPQLGEGFQPVGL